MTVTRFALIGSGWRAEFFIRIAQALPDRFQIARVLIRDPEKARAFAETHHVPTCSNIDDISSDQSIHFSVLSIRSSAHPQVLSEMASRNMAVLCETPPARSVPEMEQIVALEKKGLRIQIAEQYHLRPMHAARLALVREGRLGNVQHVEASIAHGNHGISLIRRLLGITFEDVRITATRRTESIIAGPGRAGPPTEHRVESYEREMAWMDFGDRMGVFDFHSPQYFSYIRSTRLLVQGDQGELCDDNLRYLKDFRTPIHTRLTREAAGENDNLEGCYLKGILAGDQWVYLNPFVPGRLSDDEIAIASCLEKMRTFAEGGPAFYSLAEACQDNYLARLVTEASKTGQSIQSERQVWAS